MSDRSLDDLRPEFRARVEAWLADCARAGLAILIVCTFRSLEEQAAIYAEGRTAPGRIVTNAKPGRSAHNFGLAIDFVPMRNGKCYWTPGNALYLQAIQLARSHNLESLAYSIFPEWAHLQDPDWKKLSQVAA